MGCKGKTYQVLKGTLKKEQAFLRTFSHISYTVSPHVKDGVERSYSNNQESKHLFMEML